MGDDTNLVIDGFLSITDEAILIVNGAGLIEYASYGAYSMLDYRGGELTGCNISQILPKLTKLPSNSNSVVTSLVPKDGEPFSVDVLYSILADKRWILRIKPRFSASDQFHRERLQTLGVLAGSIAHDFNNILTGILGHTSYLRIALPPSGAHIESLSAIEDGARKSALITQQILNFSKVDSTGESAEVDLGKIMESTYNLLKGSFSRNQTVVCEPTKRSMVVKGSESQLVQVIINLVVNARDALNRDGLISIRCTDAKFQGDTPHGAIDSVQLYGNYAVLSVEDNGYGIKPELREQIFKPYFSTKKARGTGLGLATVDSIVRSLGGIIGLISEVEVGTTISIYLPLVQTAQRIVRPNSQKNVIGGTESVLVVDDEVLVRNVISMGLERLGYRVKCAASGPEAIEIFKANPEGFDLVVLDMIMPQMSGVDVFFKLIDINPNIRVLISTAYTSDESITTILSHGGKGLIQKPFTIDELAAKVRSAITE